MAAKFWLPLVVPFMEEASQVSARAQVSKRDGLNKEWRTRVLYTKLSLTVGSSPTAFLWMQKCQA